MFIKVRENGRLTMVVAMRVVRSDQITAMSLSSADILWSWIEQLVKEKQKMVSMFHLSNCNDGIPLLIG